MSYSNVSFYNETSEEYPPEQHHPFYLFQLVVLGLVGLVGLIGNSAVVALIAMKTSLHTIPNFYILSRGLGDILHVIMNPVLIINAVNRSFLFGSTVCKLINCIAQISVLMSNLFFTYMVVDCYLQCRGHTLGYRKKLMTIISGVTWIIGILLCIPIYIFTRYDNDYYSEAYYCDEFPLYSYRNPLIQILSIFTVVLVPFILIFIYISLMYPPKSVERDDIGKQTKQLRHLMFALSVTFAICQIVYWFRVLASFIYPMNSVIFYSLTMPLLDINVAINAVLYILYIEDLRSIVFFWRRNVSNHFAVVEEMAPL